MRLAQRSRVRFAPSQGVVTTASARRYASSGSSSSSSAVRSSAVFWVNGERCEVDAGAPTGAVRASTTLLDYLRGTVERPQPASNKKQQQALPRWTGPKMACGEGGCGACTVTVARPNANVKGGVEYRAVNSCLAPVLSMDGAAVITVEGIGSVVKADAAIHPVQERLASYNGSQCGFCTPGFVMSMYSTLARHSTNADPKNQLPTAAQMIKSLDGNLCRCTAYRPIVEAATSLSKCEKQGSQEDRACSDFQPDRDIDRSLVAPLLSGEGARVNSTGLALPLLADDGSRWHAPRTTAEMLMLLRDNPTARLVSGATELSIENRFLGRQFPVLINAAAVRDGLDEVRTWNDGSKHSQFVLSIGSATTLTSLWGYLEGKGLDKSPEGRALVDQVRWFSGTPIRNVATVGANIVNASPIGDLAPVFVALDARYVLQHMGADGEIHERSVPAAQFNTAYRRTVLAPGEALVRIDVPLLSESSPVMIEAFKQSRRREDDIAIVTACFRAASRGGFLDNVRIGLGGVAATTIRARATEQYLEGKPLTRDTLNGAVAQLTEELGANLSNDAPGGMPEYRTALAAGFLTKWFLKNALEDGRDWVSPSEVSGANVKLYHTDEIPKSNRKYNFSLATPEGRVHKNEVVLGAYKQCTGEATYIDDVAPRQGELHAYVVPSPRATGTIKNIDRSAALTMPGVVSILTSEDVPGDLEWGDIWLDEPVIARGDVLSVGQPVALVIATSPLAAREAARAVRVTFDKVEDEKKPILTVDDAIKRKSFYEIGDRRIENGNVDTAMATADVVVEGEVNMSGQEHFYFEPQSSICYPEEGDYKVLASTQNANKTQKMVARILGIPMQNVVVELQRVGGGFGGKETRNIGFSCLTALASYHTGQPVRLVLDRDLDMQSSGGRHPFKAKYKVGATRDGKLVAADLELYSNGGLSLDLSLPVLDRALLFCDGCFNIPNIRTRGHIAKTHMPSNTAFRGFGAPQGELLTRVYIDHIARELGLSAETVREKNLYEEGDLTYYGFPVPKKVKTSWELCKEQSRFEQTRQEVEAFNKEHKYRKRGFALVPTKFGVGFTVGFLNQGSTLLHVYTDGTCLVTHGGVDMGQGLHTKVAQVVAHELGIPLSKVHIRVTATDKIPNSSATAASMGSDIYGAAAQDAARQIKDRLAPFREKLGPQAKWKDVVGSAYMAKTNLSAQGWFSSEHPGFDFVKRTGTPWRYFTLGTAATLVEIDALTGDHKVLRSDLVLDVGQSINPEVDIGQIEGAFLQGQGWTTIEEMVWADDEHSWASPKGRLISKGPGAYKLPSADDAPVEWNITLMDARIDEKREITPVHSAKAVGEPPLLLGMSVYDALKDAIYAYRSQSGAEGFFPVDSPLTSERIRMACVDDITRSACASAGSRSEDSAAQFKARVSV